MIKMRWIKLETQSKSPHFCSSSDTASSDIAIAKPSAEEPEFIQLLSSCSQGVEKAEDSHLDFMPAIS